jgi:predicted PurR-regulated permease PerM
LGRLLWGRRALASALTCLILALVILIPLFSLLTIIARQALEFSSTVSQGLQTGHLWQWVAPKLDAVKGYLHHPDLLSADILIILTSDPTSPQ